MANNINCTCGHSWSKASSSKKDMYVCHICGKDNTMKDGGWLGKYNAPQAQDGISTSDRDKLMQFIQKNAGKNTDAKKTDTNVSDNKALTKEDMQRIASKSNPTIVTNTREQAETKAKAENERVIKENKEAQEKLKKERAAASKTRKAVISGDESAEFTFPDGTTKKWKDMDSREQSYVSGKNLGSWNNDNWTDYINPLSMLGSMAEGIGTASYEAERTNSVMPYISGIASPLLTGALGGLGAKNTGQFVENVLSPAPFSMSNARNFLKFNFNKPVTKADLFAERLNTGLNSQLSGIEMGLREKYYDLRYGLKGRPLSEIFPLSKSAKKQARFESDVTNLEGSNFVKDWIYESTGEIRPDVKAKIDDIMFTEGSPYLTSGFKQNYSPFVDVKNPMYVTPNVTVNTRYNNVLNEPFLTKEQKLNILQNRDTAAGINSSHRFAPMSYTFENMGLYNYPFKTKLSTAVHEGAHTMQKLGAYEAGNRDSGFGSMLAIFDKDYGYYIPNPNTKIGKKFAEVMPEPIKGQNNWTSSPNELHSELMSSRNNLLSEYMEAGHSYNDAMKAVRTNTDKNLHIMIEIENLDRFFKKGTSKEKKHELLRLLPAVIPAVGAVGTMGGKEEQKRDGGWLSKFNQGGMVLKQKTDNYGKKPNPNNVEASVGPDFVGLGYDTTGRNYSPAWGGQFQDGGKMKAYQDSLIAYTENEKSFKDYKPLTKQIAKQIGQDYQPNLVYRPKEDSKGYFVTKKPSIKKPTKPTEKVEHITVNDPKDPRLKAYQDSLKLSQTFPRWDDWADLNNSLVKLNGKAPTIVNTKEGLRGVKKPVQPVEYKKLEETKSEETKPTQPTPKGSKKYIVNGMEVSEEDFLGAGAPTGGGKTVIYSTPKLEKQKVLRLDGTPETDPDKIRRALATANKKEEFQSGGFLEPISYKLPSRYRIPYAEPSSELAMSIGGEGGEPAYLIPSFKYGKPLKDPIAEYKKTGEHLGGPFKTYQEADKWEQEVRHPYVEQGKPIPTPLKRWGDMAMGGTMQYGGSKATTDSVRHQANKILQYEQLRGGPGGAPLPYYSDPKYMDMLMNKVYPEVRKIMPGATAMEAGEAMDFVFNAGFDQNTNKITKDPRAFALQEYYRQYDSSKLDADEKWSGRKNPAYSFDQEYANTIGKLPENERRTLMNKGRDWYYKNINNPAPGVPNSNYDDTWYGRIWNTNDFLPFDPKNPKFTPKKQMGGSLPGAVGFTYARTAGSAPSNGKYAKKTKASAQNGKEMKFYQEGLDFKPNNISEDGDAIVDPMGQWAHPGEVTIIPSTDITMEGVDYPVLGISDTGDQQMMYPGEDYQFDGEYVTEYPMMKKGGWLNKYK